jgi:DHA1 family bicyclomycin/chloramphenicol resistance-like MFS transporter
VSLVALLWGGLVVRSAASLALLAVVLAGDVPLVWVMTLLVIVMASTGFTGPNSVTLGLVRHPEAAGAGSALFGILQFGVGALVAPLVGIGGAGSALPMAALIVAGAVGALLPFLLLAGGGRTQRPVHDRN